MQCLAGTRVEALIVAITRVTATRTCVCENCTPRPEFRPDAEESVGQRYLEGGTVGVINTQPASHVDCRRHMLIDWPAKLPEGACTTPQGRCLSNGCNGRSICNVCRRIAASVIRRLIVAEQWVSYDQGICKSSCSASIMRRVRRMVAPARWSPYCNPPEQSRRRTREIAGRMP